MYKKLKEIRYRKNITAGEVAQAVGISKAYYCQIENHRRRLSYEIAIKIANYFGVKPDYLFYDETLKLIEEKGSNNIEE